MIQKLLKFNSWYAFACGVFCLMVAPMIVSDAMRSLGVRHETTATEVPYLIAVTFVRVTGILLFAYAFLLRLRIQAGLELDNLRAFFGVYAIGLLVWGGIFIFVIFLRSAAIAAAAGIGLLSWLLILVFMLFEYRRTDEWKDVKPQR